MCSISRRRSRRRRDRWLPNSGAPVPRPGRGAPGEGGGAGRLQPQLVRSNGAEASLRIRKRIEEVFGWAKTRRRGRDDPVSIRAPAGERPTQDLTRCRLFARTVALIYDWWSLFVRLADPEHHREAITSRPLLLTAVARQTRHAGQVTLTVCSTHGAQHRARRAYVRIAGFLGQLRKNAEQLSSLQRWYRILSEALRHYLHGRQLQPPPCFSSA